MEQYKIGGEPENSDTVYNEVIYNVGNDRILTNGTSCWPFILYKNSKYIVMSHHFLFFTQSFF